VARREELIDHFKSLIEQGLQWRTSPRGGRFVVWAAEVKSSLTAAFIQSSGPVQALQSVNANDDSEHYGVCMGALSVAIKTLKAGDVLKQLKPGIMEN
jgi:hypothetical protein